VADGEYGGGSHADTETKHEKKRHVSLERKKKPKCMEKKKTPPKKKFKYVDPETTHTRRKRNARGFKTAQALS